MSDEGLPYVMPFAAQFDPRRAQEFIIQRLIRGIHTNTLVQVLKVIPTPGSVGYVDVLPLVQEQDTRGKVLQQTPIYNVPYFRLQGGQSAIIMDPAVGDIGIAQFAERDIRNVKANKTSAPAGSDRVYSSADALYIGGVLNGDPTQYVKFKPGAAGIDVVTPGDLTATVGGALTANVTGNLTAEVDGDATLTAATITLNGPVTINGTLTTTGTITAPDLSLPNASSMNTHKHGGVQTGGGNTGNPHN